MEISQSWNFGNPSFTYKRAIVERTVDDEKEEKDIRSDNNLSKLLSRRKEAANDGIEDLSCPVCGCAKLKAHWYINELPFRYGIFPEKKDIEKAVLRYRCLCKDGYGEGIASIENDYFWPDFTKLATKDDIIEARKFWERTCQKRLEKQFEERKQRYSPMAAAFAEALAKEFLPLIQQK